MSHRHLSPDVYAAQGIGVHLLYSVMSMIGAVNASSCLAIPAHPIDKPSKISADDIQKLSAHMLSAEKGERFPVGEYEMLALRFVLDDDGERAVTLLSIEDYHSPYPALVDGHVIDRETAISQWLGDGDLAEHPDLYLS